jgi:hypothetical protein
MTQQARENAQRLLDAQVAFLVAELSGERFAAVVAEEVDHALANAAQLTLDQVVTREQIQAVVRKYMALMQIHGSIPELMGEIAERVYVHPANDHNRIGEVLAQKHVAAVTGKLLAMSGLRQRLFDQLAENPLAVSWLSWLLYRTASDMRERVEQLPGVALLLGGVLDAVERVAPAAGGELDLRLRELADRGARILLGHAERASAGAAEQTPLFDAVMDLYDDQAGQPVSVFRRFVSRDDLEDLLVIGYELWLDLRETEYLRALVDEGIDFFFDKYGPFTLRDLLEEMGIRREDLVEEALRFGPPVIEVLRENGMLAAALHRRLEPFFFSDEVLALLAQ